MIDQATLQRIGQRFSPLMLQYFDAAKMLIAADATDRFMQEGRGATGPNPDVGPGSLRRVSGRLSRSLVDAVDSRTGGREGISEITVGQGRGTMRYGSKVPYAAVHEDGFSGRVRVSSHSRVMTQAFGQAISPQTVTVPAHTRMMNIPPRPYLDPARQSTGKELAEMLADMAHKAMTEELE